MPFLESRCPRCEGHLETDAAGAVRCPRCGSRAVDSRLPAKRVAAKAQRPGLLLSVAGLAVIAAGIAAAGIYGVIARAPKQGQTAPAMPAPKTAQSTAPISSVPEPVDASEHCELQLFPGQAGGPPIVVLTAPGKMTEFPKQRFYGSGGRLFRELIRQAVLLAARDQLGLPVRDLVVGDLAPAGKPSQVVTVDAIVRNEKVAIQIYRGDEKNREMLLAKEVRNRPGLLVDQQLAIGFLEPLTRDSLPEILRKVTMIDKPGAKQGDDGLPDGVEERIGRMAFVEQFAAIRALHAAISMNGPSPRRLAALSRAYANLGLLTEFQWDAASVAYKARALWYAQRLVAAKPKSPHAHWDRAYTNALTGLFWWATEELDEARHLVDALPAAERPSPPSWVPLIDATCRYAYKQLAAASRGPDAELAAVLHLMTLEFPPRTDVALRAARAAIAANPECFRAHDALCEVCGVANLHIATTLAPEVLATAVPRHIAAIPGLPEPARRAAERLDEVALTQALDEASNTGGDSAELSWSALAKIVRETRFAFTSRRLEFMRIMWSVPTDEYWAEVKPLVASHRFSPYLESFVGAPVSPVLRDFAANLDTTDLNFNALPLMKMVAQQDPARPSILYGIVGILADWTVRDLSMRINLFPQPPYGLDHARKLAAVSPSSPFAMAKIIEDAWDQAAKSVHDWKKMVGDHPTFVRAMALHYVKVGAVDDAERELKRSIELSPDVWAYQDLAEIYRKRGDRARSKATLDEFLTKVEDHGLDHATVRVAIANELMQAGDYAGAWPYAEAAAKTWAGWAMTCAQNCAEGLRNWEAAAGYARANSERYPGSGWGIWIGFCERTGHGDLAAARAWTKELTSGLLENPSVLTDDLAVIAYVQLLCGDKATAASALRRIPKDVNNPIYVTALAAAGDLVDAQDVRDAALAQFCTAFQKSSPKSAQIFQLIRDAIAVKKPGALDLKAIDSILDSIPLQTRGNTAFTVAAHLTADNRPNDAKRYWHMVAEIPQTNFWWRVIASSILRDGYPRKLPETSKPAEA